MGSRTAELAFDVRLSAIGAGGRFIAANQFLELAAAFLAGVFVDRHHWNPVVFGSYHYNSTKPPRHPPKKPVLP